jgi:nitroimidazol reductase NimA-like FMN-containing flavoprotein (pyridoxamine 5'-phosphate oxidase superfamily)
MAEDVGGEIRKYIESHNVCTLAVAEGSSPSAHTVYYVSDGLRVYFESNPNSDKIRILKSNPKVCLTIDEDYKDWSKIKGIQLFGRAKIAEARQAPRLEEKFREKFPHLGDMGGIPENHVFVEVTPNKIYFLDFSKKLGHKSVYYPQELGQGLLSKINW